MAELGLIRKARSPRPGALTCMAFLLVISACSQNQSSPRVSDDPRTAPHRFLMPEQWGIISRYVPGLSVTLLEGPPRRPHTVAIDGTDVFGSCPKGDDCLGFVGRVGGRRGGTAGATFLYLVAADHRDAGDTFALFDSIRDGSGSTVLTRAGLRLLRDPHMRFVGCGRAPTTLATTGQRYGLEVNEVTGRITEARCLKSA